MKPSPYFRDFLSVVIQMSTDQKNKTKLSELFLFLKIYTYKFKLKEIVKVL